MIGLLSPDITESNYVLCELGASWGRDIPTFPLLVRGATPADVPSPLNERHSISLESPANCLQLVGYIQNKTSLRFRDPQPPALAEAAKLLSELASRPTDVAPAWQHVFTKNHTGPVWTKFRQPDVTHSARFESVLIWGQYCYVGELDLAPNAFVYLRYRKRNADMTPLHVRVYPACQVSFGEGEPPEDPICSIELKWARLDKPAD